MKAFSCVKFAAFSSVTIAHFLQFKSNRPLLACQLVAPTLGEHLVEKAMSIQSTAQTIRIISDDQPALVQKSVFN